MQTEVDVRTRSFEYRGKDGIHMLSFLLFFVLLGCVPLHIYKGIETAMWTFVLMGLVVILICLPELMRNRQDVVTVDVTKNECHAKNRRLFLADQLTTFGRDEIDVIGLREVNDDGDPLFIPVVRTKSGSQFAVGASAYLVSSAQAKAKEFADVLGLNYQENILQEAVSTATKEAKADA